MSNQKHIVLSTKDLSIGYRSKKNTHVIASALSIDLLQGQLVGLVGINGSGKSTLLRTLAGLQEVLSGEVTLSRKRITSITPSELAKQLSVVLTNQQISKNLSVAELVTLGRHPYTNWLGSVTENDTEIIIKSLKDTDTFELKDKKCYELSDGQLQRVLIARALAQDTPIILLDEPMTHLDLHHKAAVLKLLQHIAHSSTKTVLFSTHDIEHTLPICDQMIVMKDGKAIIDTPENLIQEGVFNALFPSDYIHFNKENGRFSIDK